MTRAFHIVSDPSQRVEVSITVPADKSISHRSIILSALASGTTQITNFLTAEDCLHTAAIFAAMGVPIHQQGSVVRVDGVGLRGLVKPSAVLDVGNSGTGMRLILGVLAGQPFETQITGDASIQKRPMQRVVHPLMQMGAKAWTHSDVGVWQGTTPEGAVLAPIKMLGNSSLSALHYTMPVASAQIKSAILLAGLYGDAPTSVIDPGVSRDHTERMMAQFGLPICVDGNVSTITPVESFYTTGTIMVPSDISSAAFWMVLGLILPKATIRLPHVGLNPTRTGILDAIKQMGGKITQENEQQREGEPVGDVIVESSALRSTVLAGAIIPRLIDEIPILAVAAAFATGTTEIRDAQELRVKESDRIQTTADMLAAFGVPVEVLSDGLRIHGGAPLHEGTVHSHGDHRIAMAASILSLAIGGKNSIIDTACVATSYPGFMEGLSIIAQEVVAQ